MSNIYQLLPQYVSASYSHASIFCTAYLYWGRRWAGAYPSWLWTRGRIQIGNKKKENIHILPYVQFRLQPSTYRLLECGRKVTQAQREYTHTKESQVEKSLFIIPSTVKFLPTPANFQGKADGLHPDLVGSQSHSTQKDEQPPSPKSTLLQGGNRSYATRPSIWLNNIALKINNTKGKPNYESKSKEEINLCYVLLPLPQKKVSFFK